jgi:citrate lyase subunit beta / citryl-CoA lyase
MTVNAGNRGGDVRSDCFVSLEITSSGGILIDLQSKVKPLYGKSIEELFQEILKFFSIEHAKLIVEDKGALPFVLAARLEAAIKKLKKTEAEFLLPFIEENKYKTARDIDRSSRLYLPGNSPKLMINAGIYKAGGIILDLEDSVAPDKKDEAQLLVRNALRSINFYGTERMVRINQIPQGLEDLKYIVPHNVNLILIPKCESAGQIGQVEDEIRNVLGFENKEIHLMPIIESALGVVHAFEIASASPNVVALAIGLEDYTADLGTQRTDAGKESFYARSAIVNAARAAGIQPIDSVFSDVSDMEALANAVLESKAMGFVGMGCIHPRQVPVINENYSPNNKEIEKAKKIVFAFEEAESKGLGVVALGSKMIDPPVVKRAINTINQALKAGKLSKEWRTDNEQ